MSIREVLPGDTIRLTWIDSGVTVDSSYAAVFNGSESLVDCGVMVDSGAGHYYHNHTTVDTPGFYVAELHATIGGLPYKRRIKFRNVLGEVN